MVIKHVIAEAQPRRGLWSQRGEPPRSQVQAALVTELASRRALRGMGTFAPAHFTVDVPLGGREFHISTPGASTLSSRVGRLFKSFFFF